MPSRLERDGEPTSNATLARFAIGTCCIVAFAILSIREKFVALFDDMGVDLPLLARVVLSVAFPVLVLALGIVGIVKEYVPAFRAVRDWCNFAIFTAGLSALAIHIAGLISPLLSLLQSLS